MSKNNSFNPFLLLSGTPGDDTVIGGKTGQGGVVVYASPMSFDQWMASEWKDDYILDGDINFDDYVVWWEYCGFSEDDWKIYNGDTWDDYFG